MKKKREEGRRIVAMNKYPHKLGSGGYQGKSEEWAKILELNKDVDSPVVRIKILGPKIGRWQGPS